MEGKEGKETRKEGKKEEKRRKEGKKERGKEGKKEEKEERKARKVIKERQKQRKSEKDSERKKGKPALARKALFKYFGVLGQRATKEGKKEEKGRKEGKKEKKGKTDRKKVRERKGKEKRVNKLWKTSCFCLLLGKEQPYNGPTFLSQKAENLVFKILKKTFVIVVWDKKTKTDSPHKTITFAHANITGHVQNARKSFHYFLGVFSWVGVFLCFR